MEFFDENIWRFLGNGVHLHRVFHGIRFKVNNGDWLS